METLLLLPYICSMLAFMMAFIGVTLEALALRDAKCPGEKYLRVVLLLYFCSLFFVWIYFFLHIGIPESPGYTGIPFIPSLLCVPILLCHAIYTAVCPENRRFSPWNYAVPAIYFVTYYIWTPHIPAEISLELLQSDSFFFYKHIPGYGAYCAMLGSVAVLRGLFSLVYGIIGLVLVIRYYRGHRGGRIGSKWLVLYITLASLPLINGILAVIGPSGGDIMAVCVACTAALIVVQMSLIIYYSFESGSLLFASFNPAGTPPHGGGVPCVSESGNRRREPHPQQPLTRSTFEHYYIDSGRYLDPKVRLTDLVRPLGTHRSALSGFINRTYGMNFSRLTAELRLREMERLVNMPRNRSVPLSKLCYKAGFPSLSGYYFAKQNYGKSGMIKPFRKK